MSHILRRCFQAFSTALTWLVVFAACCGVTRAESLQFNRDIRPILAEHCFACHGPDSAARKGDLRLDRREDAVQSGVFSLDHLADSELLQRIESTGDEVMPPRESQKPLSAEQKQLLRRWLEAGAPYEAHWSFLPPRQPELPTVQKNQLPAGPIDRFVLAQLEQRKRSPAPAADRHTLIRRLTLDLTGLPPTPEEVERFLADTSPNAYERVVDRLLESPQYGEHMARHWLDAARYADTNGYQYDLERDQWVWRDWVIHAFNSNMPYDQFTVEQLAGDLLPDATPLQRLATGFHRNHPITIEGGVIDEEYRTEYVVDRVVTTSTVWLGLTMTCGRCHDHKYDPISQREFYRFFAFFNNIDEKGHNGFNPKLKVESPLRQHELAAAEEALAECRRRLEQVIESERKTTGSPTPGLPLAQFAQWEQAAKDDLQRDWQLPEPKRLGSRGGAELTRQPDGSVLATGPNPATDTYEVILPLEGLKQLSAVRLEALVDSSTVNGAPGRGTNGNFVLSEFELAAGATEQGDFQPLELARAEADYSQRDFGVELAIDGKIDRKGWAIDGNTRVKSCTAVFHLKAPLSIAAAAGDSAGETADKSAAPPARFLRVKMSHNYGLQHQIARFRLSLYGGAEAPTAALASVLQSPAEQRSEEDTRQLEQWLLTRYGSPQVRAAAAALQAAQQRLQQTGQAVPDTMVMRERSTPRTTHVLRRGEYDKPGEEVQAGTPEALPPMPADATANRLGLARWLVMSDHPLTARVAVNRLWQQLFGVGLVKTANDFGTQGEWPSHPELLDWLAVDFVESGWNVKAMLKQIVMSATYRQSSVADPELLAADPENRLLARGPRRRLDAEVIRDSALLASGLLSDRIGGPSVFPYHPAGLWQEINNRPGYSRTYQQDHGEALHRRSLYTFWKRTVPPPSLAAFDAPEREFCIVQRSRTNTPLQALVLLHDPQYVEAARHLAARVLRADLASDVERIRFAFGLSLARPPSEREAAMVLELLQERRRQYAGSPDSAQRVLAVGERPSAPLPPAEHAAWTAVARVLLNLSEFITQS
ncbi:MAG: PSD1 domain-containing protein [Planctomycetales bacterium]|nr:PSD1 domain-containing protein [Planctomycetales bacterium]